MPGKRATSKKGKKNAKGKKPKGKKGKPKPKKIPKKYLGMTFDGVNIYYKARDELEFIAETLRSQIDKERSERIKFQMQRDLFAELNSLYLLRLNELRVKQEWNASMVNKMNQDVVDQKVIKAQEGKHFRYEAQLLLSSGQMRDEIRRKRLKDKVKNYWRSCYIEGLEYDERMITFPNTINELIVEQKATYEGDTAYIDEVHQSRAEFANQLEKATENSEKELEIMSYFEISSENERFNDGFARFSNNFEWIFLTAKNYYLDQVHNMLNLIVMMMDHWDEMDMDSRFYEEQQQRYATLLEALQRKQRSFQGTWTRAKARHHALLRLRNGLENTYMKIRNSGLKIGEVMGEYKILTHNMTTFEDDRMLLQRAVKKCSCDLSVEKKKVQPLFQRNCHCSK